MSSDFFSEIKEAVQEVQILNVREVRAEKDGIYAICEVGSHRCYPYRTYMVNNKYNIKIDTSLYVGEFYRYVGDELLELPEMRYLDDAVYSAVYDEVAVKIYDYTKSKYEAALASASATTISSGFYLSCGDEIIYEKRSKLCNENTEKITRMDIFTLAEALSNKELKKEEAEDYIKLAYLDAMSAAYLNKLYITTEVAALTEFRSTADYLTDTFQKVMLFDEYGYHTDNFGASGFMNNLMESETVMQTSDKILIPGKLLEAHRSELDKIEKSFNDIPKKNSPVRLAKSLVPGILFLTVAAALLLLPPVAELFASEISSTIFVVTHIAGTVLLLPFSIFPGVIWYVAFEGVYKFLDNKFILNNGTYSRIVIGILCLIIGALCTKNYLSLKSHNKSCEITGKATIAKCSKRLELMYDTFELLEKNSLRSDNDTTVTAIKAYCSFAKTQVDRVMKKITK